MNKKVKERNLSVFQIFMRGQDAAYPQLLVKYIDADSYQFEIEKAEMLLTIWTDQYKKMPQINKSTYYNVLPRLLKLLYSVYVSKAKALDATANMYFMFYKKWNEMTAYIAKGLKQNHIQTLILLWKISFNMIKAITQVQREEFGAFLADQFERPLSKFKWTCHSQKIYILQTVKYINNDIQYQSFIQNGKQWSQVVRAMKQEQFRTQIIKSKGQMHLQLFKFEYQQGKLGRKYTPNHNNIVTHKHGKKTMNKQQKKTKIKTPYELQMQKKIQKEFLSREQINMFLVVKDQQQQRQIYRLQLISEIISNRPLLSIISEQYWETLAYQIIIQFVQKMEVLNIQIRTHVLLSKVFLGLLRYRKTAHIIKQKIGQQIVVKIISNIETLEDKSPFQNPQLKQIPTLVNKAFFQITPQMVAQGVTLQTLIARKIKSIIDQANMGKDDIINRSLMTVSCRQQFALKIPIIKQVKLFLIHGKKKKGLLIQTCIILVRILLSSIKSPDIKQLNFYSLVICLVELTQLFLLHKKINQFRKLIIQLLIHLIPMISEDQNNDQSSKMILIQHVLRWMQNVQLNFSIVFTPMIHVLIIILNLYKDILITQDRSMENFQKILTGIMEKLGHQHDSQNMFAFLDCIMKAYIKLQWSPAYQIFKLIPEQSFVGWQIIYRKQALALFKKEEQKKWLKKQKDQKAQKQKQKKWNRMLQRKGKEMQQSTQASTSRSLVNEAEEKRSKQKMQIYFGKLQISWLRQLINDHELWNKQVLIKSQFGILQYSLIQTVFLVQKDYFIKSLQPNQFVKQIILSVDQDLEKLFAYLMDSESYQLLFLFASKIFFICRDFFFIKNLKSYQLLKQRCFAILSVFFNKIEILYASSAFSSLFLPYINNPKQLKRVYDELNHEQFLTDLFKGSNQFIGKQKRYYPWLIKILMAYQMTQQFRANMPLVKEALITLSKNVGWWANVQYMINGDIEVYDQEVKESKILIFDIFKEEYKKLIDKYFSMLQNMILVQKKHKQIMSNI